MILSPVEAALFFRLMLPLQYFVSRKLKILPKINSFEKYVKVSMQDKFEVRSALFENVGLIDEFIDENPQDFPMKDLAIVSRWKNFIAGEFFLERFLKNYAIFISDEDQVFAVRGLTQSLDEYFPKFTLPVRLNSVVLLLFLDKIVTDGFFKPYPVVFGGNIKSELKEVYAVAKRKNKIVAAL